MVPPLLDDNNNPFMAWILHTGGGPLDPPQEYGYAKKYDPVNGAGGNAELSAAERERIWSWENQHGGS
jgi:hypothetical protein